MQELFGLTSWLARRRRAAADRQRSEWLRDPLAHPALSAMTAHQLADLPLERVLFQRETPAVAPAAAIIPFSRPRPQPQPQADRAA